MKNTELKQLLLDTFGKLDDKQLLALTIYGEARGEGRAGMIAVGSVILERVDHREWDGDTIQEVCLMPWQFSCFLPGDPNFEALSRIAASWDEKYRLSGWLQHCYGVASGLIEGTIARTPEIAAGNATQYCTSKVNPGWKARMKKVAVVGHHEFYA